MKGKYFIQQFNQQEYVHGGIGCIDVEKILLLLEFTPISFPHHFSFSIRAKISRLFFLLKMVLLLKRGSVVAFLFPVYARMNWLLLWFFSKKGIKLVCIIADIEGMRDADQKLMKTEKEQLSQCRFFIVHNESMKSLIQEIVPGSVCSVLYFFDFLTKPLQTKRTKQYSIVFAGNLAKSKFLSSLDKMADPGLHFNLYGPGMDEKILLYKNVSYYGVHKPYDMPSEVRGSFGLIWDGESIDSCTGGYGEYLRYNSQHKLSLYILSGLPVIIWDEAATAELVEQYKIGITVKHLNEITDKINAITDDEYQQMQINMHPLAESISRGKCLSNAIEEIMKLL